MLLSVSDIHAGYDGLPVLHGISLSVRRGEICALIGANGAGKTTLLRCISRLLIAVSGEIVFDGQSVTRCDPASLVSLGLVHVPEGKQLFGAMSIQENLEVGSILPAAKRLRHERMEMVFDLFPVLRERRHQVANLLSGGEQQMLAIARGLMAVPRLLMLDEPSLGLAPRAIDGLFDTLLKIRDQGVTLLLVEQNAVRAVEIADHVQVLESGRIVQSGRREEVMSNDDIRRAYLGVT